VKSVVPLGEAHLTFCDDNDDDDTGHDVADHDVSGEAAVLALLAAVVVDVVFANAQLFGVDVLVDGGGLSYCQTLSWMQPQHCYYHRCY
jgi:hypothetical protein